MLKKGHELGNYQIRGALGAGGMGEVYLATDKTLGRSVAIKVLSKGFSDNTEAMARFEMEAKALAKINHENIVQIFAMGDHKGSRYIVMEYVDGMSLSKLFYNSTLSLADVISLITQVLKGVQAAHAQRILHRDIKPANIVVDENLNAKLLDFGIVKEFGGGSSDGLTRANEIIGTIEYLAPEIIKGLRPTVQSDIYSIGVMLFELLCGYKPFAGQNSWDVMEKIRNKQARLNEKVVALLPDKLQQICLRMLDKDPMARYATIEEVLNDLKQLDLSECRFLLERAPTLDTSITNLNPLKEYLQEKGHATLEVNAIINRALHQFEHEKVRKTGKKSQDELSKTQEVALNVNLIEEVRREYATNRIATKTGYVTAIPANKPSKRSSWPALISRVFLAIGVIAVVGAVGFGVQMFTADKAELEAVTPQIMSQQPKQNAVSEELKPKKVRPHKPMAVPSPLKDFKKFFVFIDSYGFGFGIERLDPATPMTSSRHMDRVGEERFSHEVILYSALDLSVVRVRPSPKIYSRTKKGDVQVYFPLKGTKMIYVENPFLFPKRFWNHKRYGDAGRITFSSKALEFFPLKVGKSLDVAVQIRGRRKTRRSRVICRNQGVYKVTLKKGLGPYNTFKIDCLIGNDRIVKYFSPDLGIHVLTVEAVLSNGGWIVITRELDEIPERFQG